ncbi:uncharacterized protein BJ212DRAFT_1345340 [Suillus subaureus]|uniref:Uncharacterized protein n=1 Tax=Suillus subaureus TaxID=48587 RepID=A0A9P7JFH9_9AGAM|nr:uncharacterized protein BJ212DRAFT_1345340 [Suillus subaureus]KAG1819302.1 hypothetical protein BJ212DRAFT_1345340 [Suillus subaureus]
MRNKVLTLFVAPRSTFCLVATVKPRTYLAASCTLFHEPCFNSQHWTEERSRNGCERRESKCPSLLQITSPRSIS